MRTYILLPLSVTEKTECLSGMPRDARFVRPIGRWLVDESLISPLRSEAEKAHRIVYGIKTDQVESLISKHYNDSTPLSMSDDSPHLHELSSDALADFVIDAVDLRLQTTLSEHEAFTEELTNATRRVHQTLALLVALKRRRARFDAGAA